MNTLARKKKGSYSFLICFALIFVLLAACNDNNTSSETDNPIPDKSYRIGLLVPHPLIESFFDNIRTELAELGYTEENSTFVQAGPTENLVEVIKMPTELVSQDVDIIVVMATEGGLLAQGATKEIPIVFVGGNAPIEAGLVESLEEPGGNVTGIIASGTDARRLEILLKMDPSIETVYIPYTPTDPQSVLSYEAASEAADEFGIIIIGNELAPNEQIDITLEDFPEDIDAIFIPEDLNSALNMIEWSNLALERKIPVSSPGITDQVNDGSNNGPLMSYGLYLPALAEQTARIVHQILQGANPSDLPIETADFYLAINLVIADEIGLEVPLDILEQADIIIRQIDTE